jgi:Conjugal transfer protein
VGCRVRTATLGLLSTCLLASCVKDDVYPPAVPATRQEQVWNASTVSLPPPTTRTSLVPPDEEWSKWRPYLPPRKVCTGTGKKRTCQSLTPNAVDRANLQALVKPSHVHTLHGQSVLVRYPLSLLGFKVYRIETSPSEFTSLILPPGEKPLAELMLNPKEWVVHYNEPAVEQAEHQLIKVKPLSVGVKGRDMLMTTSGYPIYLDFVSYDRPGMLSVTWDLPPRTGPPPPPPMDQRPPKFDHSREYTGYALIVEGKKKLTPPWMPKAVMDDGKNTLVRFGASLEGQRMPVVMGLDQQGKDRLVASRLYVHPDKKDDGYFLLIGQLHPAFRLKDSSGQTLKVVRQPPQTQETLYEQH